MPSVSLTLSWQALAYNIDPIDAQDNQLKKKKKKIILEEENRTVSYTFKRPYQWVLEIIISIMADILNFYSIDGRKTYRIRIQEQFYVNITDSRC